jgi:hypothetical protein
VRVQFTWKDAEYNLNVKHITYMIWTETSGSSGRPYLEIKMINSRLDFYAELETADDLKIIYQNITSWMEWS